MVVFHQIRSIASKAPLTRNPLPKGEGVTPQAVQASLSPWGEGRGEGVLQRLLNPFERKPHYFPAVLNSAEVFFTRSQTTSW
jgi:hypothetical protein